MAAEILLISNKNNLDSQRVELILRSKRINYTCISPEEIKSDTEFEIPTIIINDQLISGIMQIIEWVNTFVTPPLIPLEIYHSVAQCV